MDNWILLYRLLGSIFGEWPLVRQEEHRARFCTAYLHDFSDDVRKRCMQHGLASFPDSNDWGSAGIALLLFYLREEVINL